MVQRRHHKRVSRQILIKCRNETLVFDGITLDICPGGVFIITDHLLSPGSVVDVEVWIEEDSPLLCLGEVTWVNRGQVIHYPPGFGLQFLELPALSLDGLCRFCTEQDQEAWSIPW